MAWAHDPHRDARSDANPRSDLSPSTPSMPFDESIDEIDRAQSCKRRRLRANDSHGRTREMRRRCEAEYVGDVAKIVAGVFRELRRGDDANEVDDPFEIR